jgi:hypothetical protein
MACGLPSTSGRVKCEAERPVVFSFLPSSHGGVGKNFRMTEFVRRRITCDRPYRSRVLFKSFKGGVTAVVLNLSRKARKIYRAQSQILVPSCSRASLFDAVLV